MKKLRDTALDARRKARYSRNRLDEIKDASPLYNLSIEEAIRAADNLIMWLDEIVDLTEGEREGEADE